MSSQLPNKQRHPTKGGRTSDPKKFKCPISDCGKAFTRNQALQAHILSHTGENPYACSRPGCHKSYRRPGELKRHVDEDHWKIKPFICDATGNASGYCGCGKTFKRKARLNQHLANVRPANGSSLIQQTIPTPSKKRTLSATFTQGHQVDVQTTGPPEQPIAKKSRMSTRSIEHEQPKTSLQICTDYNLINGLGLNNREESLPERALFQPSLRVADNTKSVQSNIGVDAPAPHQGDGLMPTRPGHDYQKEDLEDLSNLLLGMSVTDDFQEVPALFVEEQVEGGQAEVDLAVQPGRCHRCRTWKCQFNDYSADRILEHEHLVLGGTSLLLICRYPGCGKGLDCWSVLVHHQFECHAEEFCSKSGISAIEVQQVNFPKLPVAQLPHHLSLVPANITTRGLILGVWKSVRDAYDRLMMRGIEVNVDELNAKLINAARRQIKTNNNVDLAEQAKEILANIMHETRQQGIRKRNERENRLASSLQREYETYLAAEAPCSDSPHAKTWVYLQQISEEEERATALQKYIRDSIQNNRACQYNDALKRRDLSLDWLKDSLYAMMSAKQFLPSIHSGDTDCSQEEILAEPGRANESSDKVSVSQVQAQTVPVC